MGGIRIALPLFITCQREGCEQIKPVANRRIQRTQRFCSRSCAAMVTGARVRNIKPWHGAKGGKMRAHRARLNVLVKVASMTPLEAFRYGYQRGLGSKTRQLKQRREAA